MRVAQANRRSPGAEPILDPLGRDIAQRQISKRGSNVIAQMVEILALRGNGQLIRLQHEMARVFIEQVAETDLGFDHAPAVVEHCERPPRFHLGLPLGELAARTQINALLHPLQRSIALQLVDVRADKPARFLAWCLLDFWILNPHRIADAEQRGDGTSMPRRVLDMRLLQEHVAKSPSIHAKRPA
jgi:hypothetical protein